uniref:ATP synthase subunit b, chloroplastic n=4 Tax=Gnetum TaxID=3380 RepID=ATPF_GNEPA|nr:ATP synthase CF0 B subunit [Gnetum parvifolium]YP_008082196.1 ATP synthase CF0 B chain [Gnetum montanum]YP_009918028.1 ATP synthase CF0 subunit I [Gnetum luofuense]A6BM11.1 RecName: Full=ATP synthase subunit b, chloroplastic; AltName: Full=ATP synthase F(0) sector subunit b; AltName: Full=ATPase subunit I [Gnetum parvifolium]ANZ54167.1 ATP synthase CF0 subunit I [Gnetum pendulum]BDI62916.1 ATP synthase CF0 B chain [Gnetum hainanense]AGL11041.1 ATP synthase CF0 B chain [Gnetum montanum]ANZ
MKGIANSLIYLSYWPSAGSFGFNTNILETNIINITVVLGILIYFGKGVLSNLLDNRKSKIYSTIQNSEELCKGARHQLEKARARLQEIEMRVDEIRANGYLQIEQEKEDLVQAASVNLKQLEDSKNETVSFEQQKVIDQVRQQVSYQALQKALTFMKNCLNTELHLRMINYNIGRLRAKRTGQFL